MLERSIDDGRTLAERFVPRRFELLHPRAEVPVRPDLPEPIGGLSEKPRVERGEPPEARVELTAARIVMAAVVPGGVEILEHENPLVVGHPVAEEPRDATRRIASACERSIEGRLDCVRPPFPCVRRIARHAPPRRADPLDDHRRRLPADEVGAYELPIATPQRLNPLDASHARRPRDLGKLAFQHVGRRV